MGLAFAGGLAVRLPVVRAHPGAAEVWRGDWDYYGIGVELAREGLYRAFPNGVLTAFRMPYYPTVIALAHRVRPGPELVRWTAGLLDLAGVGLVFALALAAGAGEIGAALGALVFAVAAISFRQAAALGVEATFGFLVLGAGAGLAYWGRRLESAWRAATAGALIGASLWCRSTLCLVPPLVAGFLLFRYRARVGWRNAALFVLTSYVLLIPWAARNARRFDAFIPFENGAAAFNFFGASVGEVSNPTTPEKIAAGGFPNLMSDVQKLDETDRGRVLMRQALDRIVEAPARFAWGIVRRVPELWSEQWWLLVLVLPLFWRRALDPAAQLLLLLLVYFNIHLLMGVTARYARPVFGLTCALAAAGGAELWRRFRREDLPAGVDIDRALKLAAAAVLLVAAPVYAASTYWLAREKKPETIANAELAALNDRGVELSVRGDLKGADAAFSAVLGADPCFQESLVSRGVVRGLAGDAPGEKNDYEQAAACLLGDRTLLEQF